MGHEDFAGLRMVPLQEGDAPAVVAHLLRLSPEDRTLRFWGSLVTDDSIRSYVAGIRFGHDIVLGLVEPQGRVVGLAHGCNYLHGSARCIEAAFSVDEERRGASLGRMLMDGVVAGAHALGADRVVGMCSVRNIPMRRIFQTAGMVMSREEDEMHARLPLECSPGAAPVVAPFSGRSGKLSTALAESCRLV